MKRVMLLLLLAACDRPASAPPAVADFSGRWLMTETDPECKHAYSECWLEITQTGDRAMLKAWGKGNDWTCEGRGAVTGNRLKFRWSTGAKGWRGTAELELDGGALRGTYQRDDVNAGVQHTRGTRRPTS